MLASVLPAQTLQPDCSVETIDSPAVLDGATRILWAQAADGSMESIFVSAYHMTDGDAAATVVEMWLETTPRKIVAEPYPFAKLLAGAANVDATATFYPGPTAENASPDAAQSGTFHLTDPSGVTTTVPFALLAVQDGAKAFLVIVSYVPHQDWREGATPPARLMTAPERAQELVLEMMARPLRSAVIWPLPCEGGMMDVLPSENEISGTFAIVDTQYLGAYSD